DLECSTDNDDDFNSKSHRDRSRRDSNRRNNGGNYRQSKRCSYICQCRKHLGSHDMHVTWNCGNTLASSMTMYPIFIPCIQYSIFSIQYPCMYLSASNI